jgi:IS30 family transposase
MGWSPQQVSNSLAFKKRCNVISYESIYRFIYAQIKRTQDYGWRNYLPRRRSYRGWRGRKGGSPALFIKDRVPICKRPSSVLNRQSPGHWEVDLMLFSKYGQAILVAHERFSRLIVMSKLSSKKANPLMSQLLELFTRLPTSLAKTVTFDNGTEFAEHFRLNQIGIKTYFCDVKSPWQKGGIENAIGRLRTPLPRKTDIDRLTESEINTLVRLYNHTPRKCLGYQTPAQTFAKQLLHLECEFTCQPSLACLYEACQY